MFYDSLFLIVCVLTYINNKVELNKNSLLKLTTISHMTKYSLFILILFGIIFFGCNQPIKEQEDIVIDKGKIDTVFNKTENKLSISHIYVVLDSSSFNNILHNTFLSEDYASLDVGLPNFSAIQKTSKSIYLRGKNSYIEILGPNNKFNEEIGKCGIGFALEHKDRFSLTNTPKLTNINTKFLKTSDTVTYTLKNKKIAWFKAFYTNGMDTNLHTWYSYYNPEFLTVLHDESIERYTEAQYLKTAYQPNKLFKDITGLEIHCTLADHFRIANELKLLGYKPIGKNNDDLLFNINGFNLSLRLKENLNKSTVAIISGKLTKSNNYSIKLDNITIENSGRETVWRFQ